MPTAEVLRLDRTYDAPAPHEDKSHGGGGRYTEVDRPRRLAFTWVWDGEDRETLIEIDFEPVDAGTEVRFTHSNLRDLESVRNH